VDEVIKVSSFTRVMNISKLWQKSLCHISRGRIDNYELRKIERQLKETQKDNWKIFPIVCFAFREK
jgi:hypothetical protein